MFFKKLFLSLIVFFVITIPDSQVFAQTTFPNTYYVSTTGNDANPGTQTLPWKTIQKANNILTAGDTLYAREGIYEIQTQDNNIAPKNSGTEANYITYKSYPGETVIIEGHYPTVGDWLDGILINGKSYIIIDGFTIRGFHAGIKCQAPGHHIIARNNILEFNSEEGFSAVNASVGTLQQSCDYFTVENNIIRSNGYRYDTGMPATGIYEGWGSGVSINAHGTPYLFDTNFSKFHSYIRRNIIYHNYDGTGGGYLEGTSNHTDGNGIILDLGGNLGPILIENNIIFDNGGTCIHSYGSQNIWIIGNTCYQNQTDPLFAGASYNRPEIGAFSVSSPSLISNNIHVINNIVYARSDRMINLFVNVPSTGLEVANNLWFGGQIKNGSTVLGTNPIQSDPLFINPSADPTTANFKLKFISPAIDNGSLPSIVRLGKTQEVDFNNVVRPQGTNYDIGAYEFINSSYYVSTTGNDANPGTLTQPWKTIQKAVNFVNPGDTIFIRNGSYFENVKITKSGTVNSQIKLTNFNGEIVTINGGSKPSITLGWAKPSPKYWTIEGLRLISTSTQTLVFDGWDLNGTSNGVDNIIIRNNYVSGAIIIYGAYNLIEGNEVDGSNNDGNGGNGIQDSYEVSHFNIFRNNHVHNFSIRGIWSMHQTHDNLYENNHVYNCGDQCINTDGYGNVEWRHIIRNNLLENCGSGVELENNFDSIVENNTIRNSTIVGIDSINYGRNVPPLNYPDTPWSLGGKRCEIGGENNQYGDLDGDNDCEGNITNNIIRQNLIVNTTGTGGINIFHAGGVKILSNTLYNNGTYASLYLACKTDGLPNLYCPQTEIKNNIFANSKADTEILLNDLSLITVDSNNLFFNSKSQKAYEIDGIWTSYTVEQYKNTTGKGVGSIFLNPLFVDIVNNNFHLQSLSPAINSGINIGLSKDLDGTARPQGVGFDIGAYEFVGSSILPTNTPVPIKLTLNFKIKFQGISGNNTASKTVNIILKQGTQIIGTFNNVPVANINDGSGKYQGIINNLNPGTYDIFIKGFSHLQRKFVSVALISGTNNLDWSNTILLAGDFDNDNWLRINDVSLILGKYNTLSTPVGTVNNYFDLNGDNAIDINDVSIILSNYVRLETEGEK